MGRGGEKWEKRREAYSLCLLNLYILMRGSSHVSVTCIYIYSRERGEQKRERSGKAHSWAAFCSISFLLYREKREERKGEIYVCEWICIYVFLHFSEEDMWSYVMSIYIYMLYINIWRERELHGKQRKSSHLYDLYHICSYKIRENGNTLGEGEGEHGRSLMPVKSVHVCSHVWRGLLSPCLLTSSFICLMKPSPWQALPPHSLYAVTYILKERGEMCWREEMYIYREICLYALEHWEKASC